MPTGVEKASTSAPPPGLLYVVCAPSGAGKTSLVRDLVGSTPGIIVSVSYTTRPPRPGEQDGREYHFVDEAEFSGMREREDLLEHARVFGNLYGTSRSWVADRLAEGIDVVLEIDWQGARQVRARTRESIGVQIVPPSLAVLETRLRSRGQDPDEVIVARMRDAAAELAHYDEFDYLVVNDDFYTALAELRSIVHAERVRTPVQAVRHRKLLASFGNESD